MRLILSFVFAVLIAVPVYGTAAELSYSEAEQCVKASHRDAELKHQMHRIENVLQRVKSALQRNGCYNTGNNQFRCNRVTPRVRGLTQELNFKIRAKNETIREGRQLRRWIKSNCDGGMDRDDVRLACSQYDKAPVCDKL